MQLFPVCQSLVRLATTRGSRRHALRRPGHSRPQDSGGNTIVAVSSGGDEKAGWPVTLTEAGAWFASIAVGNDGTVYGFAIEPAGARTNTCGERVPVYSGTIVALDAKGDSLWVSTIVAP